MTYEEYLDEVTTLLTEIFTLTDDKAIEIVMRAQDDDYFSEHDDNPAICTQERAELDVRAVFKKYKAAKKSQLPS
jgi:ATP-dependent Clp protease adapter protein ClpS